MAFRDVESLVESDDDIICLTLSPQEKYMQQEMISIENTAKETLDIISVAHNHVNQMEGIVPTLQAKLKLLNSLPINTMRNLAPFPAPTSNTKESSCKVH